MIGISRFEKKKTENMCSEELSDFVIQYPIVTTLPLLILVLNLNIFIWIDNKAFSWLLNGIVVALVIGIGFNITQQYCEKSFLFFKKPKYYEKRPIEIALSRAIITSWVNECYVLCRPRELGCTTAALSVLKELHRKKMDIGLGKIVPIEAHYIDAGNLNPDKLIKKIRNIPFSPKNKTVIVLDHMSPQIISGFKGDKETINSFPFNATPNAELFFQQLLPNQFYYSFPSSAFADAFIQRLPVCIVVITNNQDYANKILNLNGSCGTQRIKPILDV